MTILFEVADKVARVTIDRPERMNALDTASYKRLAEIWAEVENNPEIRCVVVELDLSNARNQSNLRNEGICFTHHSRYAPW